MAGRLAEHDPARVDPHDDPGADGVTAPDDHAIDDRELPGRRDQDPVHARERSAEQHPAGGAFRLVPCRPGWCGRSLVGDTALALEDIAAGAVGRVELRGTTWSARNSTTQGIPKGRRCTVIRTDRLMLFVRPEEATT